MNILLFLLLIPLTLSAVPSQWESASQITERHEFYKDQEPVVKPKGSWEVLFAVVYPTRNLRFKKDCVIYQVPGLTAGTLKIKSISLNEKCDKVSEGSGDKEWKDIESLSFSADQKQVSLRMRFSKTKSEGWNLTLPAKPEPATERLLLSSSEFRIPSLTYLASSRDESSPTVLKDGQVCLEVTDLCEAKGASQCHLCPEGWFEVPNGCKSGPRYCGIENCGGKNQPACRRGMKYQRKEARYECRRDASFAYCQKGLSLQCEGSLPYCR